MSEHSDSAPTGAALKYGGWALITGASSGIGAAIAHELGRQGQNLILVARTQSRLESVAAQITAEHGVEVHTVALDLTRPEATTLLSEAVGDRQIGLLVPNAGAELVGDFVDTELSDNQRLVQLNISSPMELCHFYGRAMARRGRGAILLVASTMGYQGVPMLANYAATKAYVLAFGEALSAEMGPRGVDVTVLSPGLTTTPMTATMPIDFSKLPMRAQSPADVAQSGLTALGRQQTVISGWLNKVMTWSNRFIPRTWPVGLFRMLLRRAYAPTTAQGHAREAS